MRKIPFILLIILISFLSIGEEKFGYEFTKGRKGEIFKITLYAEGVKYDIIPTAIKVENYLLYFAAENLKEKKSMLMDDFKEVKVVRDEENKKDILTLIYLHDGKGHRINDYILQVTFEIWKGYPFLAFYSKLKYMGDKKAKTALNWGIGDHFKYYTIPKGRKVKTFKLQSKGRFSKRKTKIGKVAWVYAHSGKGYGLGIITPWLVGKGEDFLFVNPVPQVKYLKKGDTMDVFILIFPVKGGYKPVQTMFEKLRKVSWDLDRW
ncbi:hypothetical protein J7K56_04060 [Candidatus Calescamantes bacterium]|nr:hypothetical protein [Candidatus Calescamantes bacterium]